jgi:hypothetical protein
MLSRLFCYIFFFFSSSSIPRFGAQTEPILKMKLRHATASDLDVITALGLAALPEDPIWSYRSPLAKQYPDEHYEYSRVRFSEYLDNVEAGVYAAVLIEAQCAPVTSG